MDSMRARSWNFSDGHENCDGVSVKILRLVEGCSSNKFN